MPSELMAAHPSRPVHPVTLLAARTRRVAGGCPRRERPSKRTLTWQGVVPHGARAAWERTASAAAMTQSFCVHGGGTNVGTNLSTAQRGGDRSAGIAPDDDDDITPALT